jgi:hypothetical protein|tara:strand:- start:500 stop:1138 length:639 start_codon:yes stop_codon:yes gene_type:complete
VEKMTRKRAVELTGGLSSPSKMPCKAYGIPALISCPTGTILAKIEGTVCHECYALNHFYQMPVVKNAQQNRYNLTKEDEWVDGMVYLLDHQRNDHFRWHDSGDVYSVEYFKKIIRVCKRTPQIKHWLPTKEGKMVIEYQGTIPNNLMVRVSASKINKGPLHAFEYTSTVVDDNHELWGFECWATSDFGDGSCGNCRACWNKDIKNISYRLHK